MGVTSHYKIIVLVLAFLIGLAGIAVKFQEISWLKTLDLIRWTRLTCDVGTSKYDSFYDWEGRIDIQEDGGSCISQWKCGLEFSFSNGSLLMSRGCLSKEDDQAKAFEGEDTEGLWWIMKMKHLDKVNLDCFMRETEGSNLSCSTTSRLPKTQGKIPLLLIEGFRDSICDSPSFVTQVETPWWWPRFLPFLSSLPDPPQHSNGLPCRPCPPGVCGDAQGRPGTPEWETWWTNVGRQMEDMGGIVGDNNGWTWPWMRTTTSLISVKEFLTTDRNMTHEEATILSRSKGMEWNCKIKLPSDKDVQSILTTYHPSKDAGVEVKIGPKNDTRDEVITTIKFPIWHRIESDPARVEQTTEGVVLIKATRN